MPFPSGLKKRIKSIKIICPYDRISENKYTQMSKEVKSVEYGLEKIFEGAQDFLPLLGTDYVEFYVGNAKQSAHYYKTAFRIPIAGVCGSGNRS
jgi:hypothetical protein